MPKHHDEYDDRHEDDDLVIEEYDLTLLDEDESYEAVIIYAKRITFYHRQMIDFVFQIQRARQPLGIESFHQRLNNAWVVG